MPHHLMSRLRAPRVRHVQRISLPALLLLALITPFLLHPQQVKPLPPVTATVKRVVLPSGTRTEGTRLFTEAARAANDPAIALFRLRQTMTAAPGRTRRVSIQSAALNKTMDYWVYLPPTYSTTNNRFPVLYMLHGLGGSSSQWKTMGLFDKADELIRNRQIAPLIIVTPQGDNGYWMNQADNGPRYADYVIQDLISHIDTTYRTLPDAAHRAIGGLSMGGHGAIQLALNYPGMFGVVGGHSPVFRTEAQAFPFFGKGETYQQRDPVSLVRDLDVPVPFALWLDMGREDRWLPRTSYFERLLTQRGIAHEWRLNPGDHQSNYWEQHIPTYLRWYDQALRAGPSQHQEVINTGYTR